MAHPGSNPARPLPTWMLILGSAVLITHLGIMGVSVLAAPSGPWPTPFGGDMGAAPQFAMSIDTFTRDWYLRPLKLTHNYHFQTNRSEMAGVWFEVKLKSEAGDVKETVRLPDLNANRWVRHRQLLLAQHLLQDRPLPPPAGEVIPAPGQRVPLVPIWEIDMDRRLRLVRVEEHRVPRDRPVSRPAELSLTLAASYVRHLCRTHDAASAELVRHSRDPLSPLVLFQADLPPGATEEYLASFGEMTR